MLPSVLDSAGSWGVSPSFSQTVNHSLLQWTVEDKKAEPPVCLPGLYILPGAACFLTPLMILQAYQTKEPYGHVSPPSFPSQMKCGPPNTCSINLSLIHCLSEGLGSCLNWPLI